MDIKLGKRKPSSALSLTNFFSGLSTCDVKKPRKRRVMKQIGHSIKTAFDTIKQPIKRRKKNSEPKTPPDLPPSPFDIKTPSSLKASPPRSPPKASPPKTPTLKPKDLPLHSKSSQSRSNFISHFFAPKPATAEIEQKFFHQRRLELTTSKSDNMFLAPTTRPKSKRSKLSYRKHFLPKKTALTTGLSLNQSFGSLGESISMFDPNQCSSLSFSQVLSNFPNFTQNPKLETEKFVPKSLQVIDADLPQTFKSGD